MHKKFSLKDPILADGDFMGVLCSEKRDDFREHLISLLKEGEQRDEKILLDKLILDFLSDYKSLYSFFEVESFELGITNISFFIDQRDFALSEGYSGIRYIALSETFFKNSNLPEFSHYQNELLLSLVGGAISIAVFYKNLENIRFSELSRHPRVFHNKAVKTNPIFVIPETISNEVGALDVFFEMKHKNISSSFNSEEAFPSGVPDMLNSIIQNMGVGVVVGDIYGNMILLNKAAQNMIGLPPSPLPYPERMRRFGNYLPDGAGPYPYQLLPFSRAIRGESFENEVVFLKNEKNSEGAWLSASGRGVRDAKDKLIGGVLVLRDVTSENRNKNEKEELEHRLLQAQKMESLGMLAGGIAHDFNNLLVGVLGNASILLRQDLVHEPGKPRLKQIEDSAIQLSELTRQLLMYAGLSPRKSMKDVCLNSVVSSMKGIIDTAISKKINLIWDIKHSNLFVNADETQLRQVILNLITNASDAYYGSLGDINIKLFREKLNVNIFKKFLFSACESSGSYVVIEVRDYGVGISEKELERIFDPFFSTKGTGRGLGLSAVLGIVKNHKGALEVHTKPNEGTTFRIYLPLIENFKEQILQQRKEEKLSGSGRVLVIDDEPLVLDVTRTILSDAGYEVISANLGNKGIEKFCEDGGDFRCVIIDMTMPDISGDEVYRKIRSISKDVPLLISSGFSKELCKGFFDGDSKSRFLEKPYPAKVLLEFVKETVGMD